MSAEKVVQDHFSLILNEPAGKIAQVVVRYSVNLIVNVCQGLIARDEGDPNSFGRLGPMRVRTLTESSTKCVQSFVSLPATSLTRLAAQILQAFHHPYYNVGRSRIQEDMFREMEQWFSNAEDPQNILESLTKVSLED